MTNQGIRLLSKRLFSELVAVALQSANEEFLRTIKQNVLDVSVGDKVWNFASFIFIFLKSRYILLALLVELLDDWNVFADDVRLAEMMTGFVSNPELNQSVAELYVSFVKV